MEIYRVVRCWIPHCLDNQITDGGEVVSLTHRPCYTSQKHHFFSVSGTYFCQMLSKPYGLVQLEGLDTLKKLNDFIGSRTRGFPACSSVSTNYATACCFFNELCFCHIRYPFSTLSFNNGMLSEVKCQWLKLEK
jgi:hypothetical protein